ncbi:MAG: hydantoinase B/oxoprolinase family protein, partial [Planctomycetota bacterium]|nr:hydantoinase B/oxoprolinase family protein [Planctomycetota bacterium]
LGRISEEQFAFPLHVDAARECVERLCHDVKRTSGRVYSPIELCDGLVRIANTHMAQAIRSVSLAKGFHPKEYVLVAFGGAAPQHACGLASELQMSRILVPTDAGILSALGMGLAPISRNLSRSVRFRLDSVDYHDLESQWHELSELASQQLQGEGIARDQVTTEFSLSMRYQQMDAELLLMRPDDHDLRREFESVHFQRFGYCHRDRSLEVTALHVEAVGRTGVELPPTGRPTEIGAPAKVQQRWVSFEGSERHVPLYDRASLQPGHCFLGPALIVESYGAVVVEPGWRVDVLDHGHLLLSDSDQRRNDRTAAERGDPIMLEVFHRNFAAIAEQMGVTLRNTSVSVNVKERLDFSCALFDAEANLVVNAPHVPVHLGGMGETVRKVAATFPDCVPGDVLVTNDPFGGGSHLPDVTVVTPVHDENGEIVFFAASRAHHAEIGGILPGSMPPFSKCLAEEGVVISPLKLIEAGQPRWNELESVLRSGRYPSRSVQENLTDIAAQIAANQQGVVDLRRLMERYGRETVESYMRDIQRAAGEKMRMALQRIPPGAHTFTDTLDDGTPIQVCLRRIEDRLQIDFSGTGPVSAGNLNANFAICTAAVMYVLRCFLDEDIPLNAGMLDPVDLFVPPGLLNPPAGSSPETSPAVAGGNVETSQRIVDVLLGALQLAAASQGTMNNLLFGDSGFGYYETICGGAGATPYGDGADAVQTHMTNTRITDPEVLESRYPVRLRRFSIRRGSGGKGKYRGGDGVVRELEFLREVDVSLLSQRRLISPYGMQGGEAGLMGRNQRIHANGRPEELPGSASYRAQPGEILRIETPGGGAWGEL